MKAETPLRSAHITDPEERNELLGSGHVDGPPLAGDRMGDPVLGALVGLIRSATPCLEAAVFEYGPPAGDRPSIGQFATLSGAALSSKFVSMVWASPHALTGISGCFDAGQYDDRGEARHLVGLRFSDGRHAFSGGYVVFRGTPDSKIWSALHGTTNFGAQIILAARKSRVHQQASADGQVFQNLDVPGHAVRNRRVLGDGFVIHHPERRGLPFPPQSESLKALEGKNLHALLASARAEAITDFRDLHVEFEAVEAARLAVSFSGRTLADGTSHGTACFRRADQNAQLTRTAARSLVEKLEEARQIEVDLRREAELVLDGLSILTSGRAGREIFKSLLDLLGPALEFQNAVVLQRDWSGRIAVAAATAADLVTLDWTEAGERLFAVDEVAAALAVPHDLTIPALPSGTTAASALSIKLKGGSKPALLLCLHEQRAYFGARHLGLGTRLSLVASQAFINEEERQRVVESAKLAGIGEMAAGIVHEINQPLTSVTLVIHNLLELLDREQGIEPERLRTKLGRLRGQIERISKIVASMRVLARRSEDANEPFSVDAAICQAAEIAQHRLTTAAVELELSICDESASGNALEFGQVILNLLTNAHDAILDKARRSAEAANDPRRITVSAEAIDQEWLEVVVRDTGCGFPSEAADHAFEAFATTKEPGKGTGLGLTLCRRIVENMNGTITARNWSGGAEICIRLKRSLASRD